MDYKLYLTNAQKDSAQKSHATPGNKCASTKSCASTNVFSALKSAERGYHASFVFNQTAEIRVNLLQFKFYFFIQTRYIF